MRVVSLLPSATEIVFQLGLGDDLVGVTFECDHPAEARSKPIVSTTSIPEGLTPGEIDVIVKERMAAGEDLYHLDEGAFRDIDPDIVLTQDLCAVCALDSGDVDSALAHLGCRADVVTLDPKTLDDVIATVATIGAATGTDERAAEIITGLRSRLDDLRRHLDGAVRRRVLMLEWTDPAFTAGHWVPDLVEAAGGECVLGHPGRHSVGVDWSVITDADADVVVVAPCGFGLDGAADLAAQVVAAGLLPTGAEVWAMDADSYVVRPGPRLIDGAEILASILHPTICGGPAPSVARRISG